MKSKRSPEPELRTYEGEQPEPTPADESVATLPVADLSITEPDLQSRIRDLAYQLYLQKRLC